MWATRPLLRFCGGTPPTTPCHGGFAPLDPPFCPPPLAEGLLAFWVPLVAGLLMCATRPFFWFLGAHPPDPLPWGLAPPGPPFCPPSWAEGLLAFWAPLVAGLLMWATRSLFYSGGTSPKPPGRGLRPLHPPVFPTLVSLGFASVLGPTRRLTR